MANYAHVVISTSSVGVMDALMEKYKDGRYELQKFSSVEIEIRNVEGETDTDLLAISSEYPLAQITAVGSFGSNHHSLVYTIEYSNGVRKLTDVEIVYDIDTSDVELFEGLDEDIQVSISEGVSDFFHNVDHVHIISPENGLYEKNTHDDKVVTVDMVIGPHQVKAEKKGLNVSILALDVLSTV